MEVQSNLSPAQNLGVLHELLHLFSQPIVIEAGIGEEYAPEELPGRLVAVVTNLKPVKLMGVESNGMLVAAGNKGKPVLVAFNEPVRLGARLQ